MSRQEKVNLRIGIGEGLLATPWVILSLPAGFIVSAMLNLYYGIEPGTFGLIASLPAWANAVQILALPFLAKFFTAREMALSMSWLNLGLWVMLSAMLSFLPADDASVAGGIFLVFFVLASLSASFIGLGWTAWVNQWVPTNIRGEYFGKRNRYIAIVTVLFLLLSTSLLDLFENSIVSYQIILILAAAMRFGSVLWQHRIVDREHAEEPLFEGNLLKQLKLLPAHKVFLGILIFNAWVNFWMNLTGPFAPVFVYEHLGMTPGQFALINVLSTLSTAASMPLWGKVIDRYGCIPAITLGLLLWQGGGYLWSILTPETTWLLYPMWLFGGMSAAGFLLGTFNLLFKVIPSEAKTVAISANLAMTSVAAGTAPIISGQILGMAQSMGWDPVLVYRCGFVLAPTMTLLSLLFIHRIKEPESDERFGGLSGSMRMARQTLQLFGGVALANTNLITKSIRKPISAIQRRRHKTDTPEQ